MRNKKKQLIIEQVDKKLIGFRMAGDVIVPEKGWLNTIRTSLNMTLRQLGSKLNISAQSVKELEEREASGAITLKTLKEAGKELDLKLVYGFIPKDGSLEKMIENRAMEIARKIVLRTSNSMKLEDQENTAQRIEKAIQEKTTEIKEELPKYLWE